MPADELRKQAHKLILRHRCRRRKLVLDADCFHASRYILSREAAAVLIIKALKHLC